MQLSTIINNKIKYNYIMTNNTKEIKDFTKTLDIFSDTLFKDIIKETENKKIEIGYLICYDKDKEKVVTSEKIYGTSNYIYLPKSKCEKNQNLGSFHTHPSKNINSLSEDDIESEILQRSQFACLGGSKENSREHTAKIRCWKPPYGVPKQLVEKIKTTKEYVKKIEEKYKDTLATSEEYDNAKFFLAQQKDSLKEEAKIEARRWRSQEKPGFYKKDIPI